MKKNNSKKGFTLVELLVVIAILAILATVSVVGYSAFIDRAEQSKADTAAAQIRTLMFGELADDGKMEFKVAGENDTTTKYEIREVESSLELWSIETGAVDATSGKKADEKITDSSKFSDIVKTYTDIADALGKDCTFDFKTDGTLRVKSGDKTSEVKAEYKFADFAVAQN